MKLHAPHSSIDAHSQSVSQHVWKLKYRQPDEDNPSDSKHRIVKGVYAKDNSGAKQALLAMELGIWVPAGRIHAGAGTSNRVTLINCFVMQSMHDSLKGILAAHSDSTFTMQQGGGIGVDFSPLRPKGAGLKHTGVGAVASGPPSFMEMWNAMCKTIMSAGTRRGAMMATLRCDHPDILDFIECKTEKGALTNFNISVLITDDFMEALAAGTDWELKFDGTVYRTIPARELWEKILKTTFEYSEPGVIFIDRVNKQNNLRYCETISCTNPCFAPGTLISTKTGLYPIEDLIGKSVEIWDGEAWTTVDNFRVTGEYQKTLQIHLQDGSYLTVTPQHKMILDSGRELQAKDLSIGQKLKLSLEPVNGIITEKGAYIKGFFLGDGSEPRPGRAWLGVYYGKESCMKKLEESLSELPIGEINTSAKSQIGWGQDYKNSTLTRHTLEGLAPRKHHLLPWLYYRESGLPREIFRWNSESKLQFIAGYFDADGTAHDSINGYGYQVMSVSYKLLSDVQTLLKTLGVLSKIGPGTKGGMKEMPGGYYETNPTWRLSITQANSIKLSKMVSFERLQSFANRKTRYNVKPRMSQIVSIQEGALEEKVYCCTVSTTHKLQIAIGILTGQCGEQPLPPNGACNLGAINLARLVEHPFTADAKLDRKTLTKAVRIGVRFLDNVLDVTGYPLKSQFEESMAKRRIGLGVTGLANMLAMLQQSYGSPESVATTSSVMDLIKQTAYDESVNLAKERGAFPLFDKERFLSRPFIQSLSPSLRGKIKRYGIRNGVLLTVAPTGTISVYHNNPSSGIEPTFAYTAKRKMLDDSGGFTEHEVHDYAKIVYKHIHGEGAELPAYMVEASDLSIDHHLRIQAAVQEHVDSSISKTINCPEDMTYESFEKVYLEAYRLGCKGCTTYKPSEIRGSVLSVDSIATKKLPEIRTELPERPGALSGTTYKVSWPAAAASFYITISNDEDGFPYEIFISSTAARYAEWTTAVALLATAIFRRGGDVSFVAEVLQKVASPNESAWIDGRQYKSLVALIGHTIENHIEKSYENKEPFKEAKLHTGTVCPVCNSSNTLHKEGCIECNNCGHSECN